MIAMDDGINDMFGKGWVCHGYYCNVIMIVPTCFGEFFVEYAELPMPCGQKWSKMKGEL